MVRDTVEISDYGEAVALALRLDPDAPGLGGEAPRPVTAILTELQAGRETGETAETASGAGSTGQNAPHPPDLPGQRGPGPGALLGHAPGRRAQGELARHAGSHRRSVGNRPGPRANAPGGRLHRWS